MENLRAIVQTVVQGYATRALNGQNYYVVSEDGAVMSVLFIGKARDEHVADASVIARLENDRVIIEQDKTNKPLVEALVSAGISREQIVLAYAGETLATA